jgi:hypothetical protein
MSWGSASISTFDLGFMTEQKQCGSAKESGMPRYDLKSGVFGSVFEGDLVRLGMLVQVQQLKVGMFPPWYDRFFARVTRFTFKLSKCDPVIVIKDLR